MAFALPTKTDTTTVREDTSVSKDVTISSHSDGYSYSSNTYNYSTTIIANTRGDSTGTTSTPRSQTYTGSITTRSAQQELYTHTFSVSTKLTSSYEDRTETYSASCTTASGGGTTTASATDYVDKSLSLNDFTYVGAAGNDYHYEATLSNVLSHPYYSGWSATNLDSTSDYYNDYWSYTVNTPSSGSKNVTIDSYYFQPAQDRGVYPPSFNFNFTAKYNYASSTPTTYTGEVRTTISTRNIITARGFPGTMHSSSYTLGSASYYLLKLEHTSPWTGTIYIDYQEKVSTYEQTITGTRQNSRSSLSVSSKPSNCTVTLQSSSNTSFTYLVTSGSSYVSGTLRILESWTTGYYTGTKTIKTDYDDSVSNISVTPALINFTRSGTSLTLRYTAYGANQSMSYTVTESWTDSVTTYEYYGSSTYTEPSNYRADSTGTATKSSNCKRVETSISSNSFGNRVTVYAYSDTSGASMSVTVPIKETKRTEKYAYYGSGSINLGDYVSLPSGASNFTVESATLNSTSGSSASVTKTSTGCDYTVYYSTSGTRSITVDFHYSYTTTSTIADVVYKGTPIYHVYYKGSLII